MRLGGRPRPLAAPASTKTDPPLHDTAYGGRGTTSVERLAPQAEAAASDSELILSPAGMFSCSSPAVSNQRAERYRELAIAIRQRIESRLAGRVHDLAVRINNDTIVLEGHCATYYTKQLAQHAAFGVLDGEPLENSIIVTM